MTESHPRDSLWFRPVEWTDSKTLFVWRSELDTIASTIRRAPVDIPEHELWMNSVMLDPRRKMLVAMVEWSRPVIMPVGLKRDEQVAVAFGLVTTTATQYGIDLAWMVAPEWRGKGLGKLMVQSVVKSLSPAPLYAFIAESNVRSWKCASAAGMLRVSGDAFEPMIARFFEANAPPHGEGWGLYAKNFPGM